jgi:hypothetical protein
MESTLFESPRNCTRLGILIIYQPCGDAEGKNIDFPGIFCAIASIGRMKEYPPIFFAFMYTPLNYIYANIPGILRICRKISQNFACPRNFALLR